MSELTVRPNSAAALADMPVAELKAELGRALEVTADNLLYLAKLWREMERRGEDLSELRSGLRVFLPLIADGRLDAQAAVQFAGNLTMLRALASQPIAAQKRMAAGERVTVLVAGQDGTLIEQKMRGDDMTASLIRQVFQAGTIRNANEQRDWLETNGPTKARENGKQIRIRVTPAKYRQLVKDAGAANVTVQQHILSKL